VNLGSAYLGVGEAPELVKILYRLILRLIYQTCQSDNSSHFTMGGGNKFMK